ncbi:hypothetical protein Btru_054390 [Bulinus truncatus]|nr:hypothetical protein Btru_054390 [Bulinus truncatus]
MLVSGHIAARQYTRGYEPANVTVRCERIIQRHIAARQYTRGYEPANVTVRCERIIQSMKNGKSPGVDNVPAELHEWF